MNHINIKAIVDVVAVLSNDKLNGNVYMLDNNKLNGSALEGTMLLETAVKKDDEIMWSSYGLEVESYVNISEIQVDKTYLSPPTKKPYEGTAIHYWTSKVLKTPETNVAYNIRFEVGNKATFYTTVNGPSIKSVTNS